MTTAAPWNNAQDQQGLFAFLEQFGAAKRTHGGVLWLGRGFAGRSAPIAGWPSWDLPKFKYDKFLGRAAGVAIL
jgi:hypothetical protein